MLCRAFSDLSSVNNINSEQLTVSCHVQRQVTPPLSHSPIQGDMRPLHVAVLHGHTELASFLIGRGAQVSPGTSQAGTTPMMIAARQVMRKAVAMAKLVDSVCSMPCSGILLLILTVDVRYQFEHDMSHHHRRCFVSQCWPHPRRTCVCQSSCLTATYTDVRCVGPSSIAHIPS